MNPLHLLLAVLIVASWGIHAPIIRMGVLEIPPFTSLAIRFGIMCLIFLPFLEIKRSYLKPIAIFALYWPIGNLVSGFVSLNYLASSSFIIIQQIMVPLGALYGWFFLKESVGWRTWAGMLVAFSGLFVVLGTPELNFMGAFFATTSGITAVLVTAQLKKMSDIPKITTIVYGSLMALPIIMTLSYIFE